MVTQILFLLAFAQIYAEHGDCGHGRSFIKASMEADLVVLASNKGELFNGMTMLHVAAVLKGSVSNKNILLWNDSPFNPEKIVAIGDTVVISLVKHIEDISYETEFYSFTLKKHDRVFRTLSCGDGILLYDSGFVYGAITQNYGFPLENGQLNFDEFIPYEQESRKYEDLIQMMTNYE